MDNTPSPLRSVYANNEFHDATYRTTPCDTVTIGPNFGCMASYNTAQHFFYCSCEQAFSHPPICYLLKILRHYLPSQTRGKLGKPAKL
jgi:hypothetical protein